MILYGDCRLFTWENVEGSDVWSVHVTELVPKRQKIIHSLEVAGHSATRLSGDSHMFSCDKRHMRCLVGTTFVKRHDKPRKRVITGQTAFSFDGRAIVRPEAVSRGDSVPQSGVETLQSSTK